MKTISFTPIATANLNVLPTEARARVQNILASLASAGTPVTDRPDLHRLDVKGAQIYEARISSNGQAYRLVFERGSTDITVLNIFTKRAKN
ncbi:type II toxin-antitoxin system RelE/ParE family toxin [Duganella aquatilis]